MIKDQYFRFRVITNLACNMQPNCEFCYQPNKDARYKLDINKMEDTMKRCGRKLNRATIMGGESTLLPDLSNYIAKVKEYVEDDICLVTNGILLNEEKIKEYAEAGLTEFAISISSIEMYYERREQLFLCKKYVPNTRINIPKSYESVGDKLVNMLKVILTDGFYVVVCEDLMGRYGEYTFEEDLPAKKIKDDGHNFFDFTWNGHQFGLFANYDGYDETDVIISPMGNFVKWESYCKKIGNDDLYRL